MARCCGSSGACSCLVVAGRHVNVSGIGTAGDPIVVDAQTDLQTTDTKTFRLRLTGGGTEDNPWVMFVQYADSAELNDFPDVNAASPANGEVLGWDSGTGRWVAQPPTVISNGVTVTNLATNPSGETNSNGYAVAAGTGGTAALSRPTTGGWAGAAHHRATWSVATTAVGGGINYGPVTVTAGEVYSFQGRVRCSKAQSVRIAVEWKDSTSAIISTSVAGEVALTANTWTQLPLSNLTAPTGAETATLTFYAFGTGATTWAAGDTLDVDAIMPEPGAAVSTYADGDSEGWEWTGPAHASTSGPRAVGALSTGSGIEGSGSPDAPLDVTDDAARYIVVTTSGVGLSDEGINRLVRIFADDAARDAATSTAGDRIAPLIGTLSVVQTRPGSIEYWDGTAWEPVTNGIQVDAAGQFLSLSGPYVEGATPVTQYVRQVTATTDPGGAFTIIPAADISGYAGVLSVTVQPTGTAAAWSSTVEPAADNSVYAIAYRLTDGTAYAGYAVTCTVTALLY